LALNQFEITFLMVLVGSMNMAVPTLAVDFGQLPKVMSPRTLKSLAHWSWTLGNCRKSIAEIQYCHIHVSRIGEELAWNTASVAFGEERVLNGTFDGCSALFAWNATLDDYCVGWTGIFTFYTVYQVWAWKGTLDAATEEWACNASFDAGFKSERDLLLLMPLPKSWRGMLLLMLRPKSEHGMLLLMLRPKSEHEMLVLMQLSKSEHGMILLIVFMTS
jgi:hypothetical protein